LIYATIIFLLWYNHHRNTSTIAKQHTHIAMSKSPSLRRIQADIRELALDPSDRYHAAPLEHDMFEWCVSFLFVLFH